MKLKSSTNIMTAKASGYLQQLCKHFGHKRPVEFSPEAGRISFDFGAAGLAASEGVLTMTATSETAEDMERLKMVMGSVAQIG